MQENGHKQRRKRDRLSREAESCLHYLLIDFENVQPDVWNILADGRFRVVAFVGKDQGLGKKKALFGKLSLSPKFEVVHAAGAGRNALDFHIACRLGELFATHPEAQMTVLSKDHGYDPVIRHLQSRGCRAYRQDLADFAASIRPTDCA